MSIYDPKPRRKKAQDAAARIMRPGYPSDSPEGTIGVDAEGNPVQGRPPGWRDRVLPAPSETRAANDAANDRRERQAGKRAVKKLVAEEKGKVRAPKDYDYGSGKMARLTEKYLNYKKGDLHDIGSLGAGGKDELRKKIRKTRRDIRQSEPSPRTEVAKPPKYFSQAVADLPGTPDPDVRVRRRRRLTSF